MLKQFPPICMLIRNVKTVLTGQNLFMKIESKCDYYWQWIAAAGDNNWVGGTAFSTF